MRILLYTDNHFSQYSSIVRGRGERFSTRLENQIESINWVQRLAEEKDCSYIIHLGDFFDKPDLNAEELTALQCIKWSNIPKYFLVGNHEMGINDLSYNSTNALKSIPNSIIVDKVSSIHGFGVDLYMIPYILEIDRKPLKNYITQITAGMWSTQECKYTVILSHNDISGIRYGQWESKVGFDVKEIEDNCHLYINGHLHNQTQVSKKILNLGNLTGQNFSEDAEKYSHCAAILDTDTLKVDLIINPHAFNFFKLDILDRGNFKKLDKCKDNSVVSIRTYQSLLDDLRKEINKYKNIINYRITTIPEPDINHGSDNKIEQLLKMDHLDQFKSYIRENLDNSEILEEELSLIK